MRISDWSSDVCSSDLREIFGDIVLADRLAEIAGREIDRALPALLHLGRPRQRGAVKGKAFLRDRVGQHVRNIVEATDAPPLADPRDRPIGNPLRAPGIRARFTSEAHILVHAYAPEGTAPVATRHPHATPTHSP